MSSTAIAAFAPGAWVCKSHGVAKDLKKLVQSPIHALELDPLTAPTPEQLQLLAADYILRTIAAMQQHQPRIAMVRVTQLNALCQEFPQLHKAYPSLASFIKFGGHYCVKPRVKATALFFLCQKAAPILKRMTAAVSAYVAEQAQPETPAPEPKHKLERLGNSLAVLQQIMPKVIDEAKLRDAALQERAAMRTQAPVHETDLFILDQVKKIRTHEIATTESALVRVAVILADAHISKLAQRQRALEYGIHKVMGTYYVMTEALLAGVARKTELGAVRSDTEITEHLRQLLHHRNIMRAKSGQGPLVPVSHAALSAAHKYFLLFEQEFVRDQQVQVKRWSFFRMPGTAEIEVQPAT